MATALIVDYSALNVSACYRSGRHRTLTITEDTIGLSRASPHGPAAGAAVGCLVLWHSILVPFTVVQRAAQSLNVSPTIMKAPALPGHLDVAQQEEAA